MDRLPVLSPFFREKLEAFFLCLFFDDWFKRFLCMEGDFL